LTVSESIVCKGSRQEVFVPLSSMGRPFCPYAFIRQNGHTCDAWMSKHFSGWLVANGKRATVSDAELSDFRSKCELSRMGLSARGGQSLAINGNVEIRDTLA
jgi:hypothetical protein